jgi:hypothetical protein
MIFRAEFHMSRSRPLFIEKRREAAKRVIKVTARASPLEDHFVSAGTFPSLISSILDNSSLPFGLWPHERQIIRKLARSGRSSCADQPSQPKKRFNGCHLKIQGALDTLIPATRDFYCYPGPHFNIYADIDINI